jgi:hypothetical protein
VASASFSLKMYSSRYRWHAIGIYNEEQVVARRRKVRVHRSGDGQRAVSSRKRQREEVLPHVESMCHASIANERNRGDLRGVRRLDGEVLSIGQLRRCRSDTVGYHRG